MEMEKEAVYLINGDKYLHLRENGAGVGFATYRRFTGEPLENGQISKQNLPPDGRNAISAARNWYLFELSDDERKAIQLRASRSSKTFRRQASAGGVSGSRKPSRPTSGSSTTAMTIFTASRTAA